MRPFSLIGSFLAGFFLVLLYSSYHGQTFTPLLGTTVGIILSLLHAGSQIINQSSREEIEIDKATGKTYRPMVREILHPMDGFYLAILLFTIGNLAALYINPTFAVFTLLITFFGISYTTGLRTKKIFFINNMHQGVARGALPILAVWSISGNPFDIFPLSLALIGATWTTSFQSTKDFNDEEIAGDRKFSVMTLPVVLGKNMTLVIMSLIGTLSFIFMGIFIISGIFPGSFIWLFTLVIPSVLILYCLKKEYRLPHLENNAAWGFFYLGLSMFYIMPAILI